MTNFVTLPQKPTTVLVMEVKFVGKTGLGKIALSFATKMNLTIAAIKMEAKPVCQTGLTKVVLNFAIKMQQSIDALTKEINFALKTGSEMIAKSFVTNLQRDTNVHQTVRSRVVLSGMVLDVQFTAMTPWQARTVAMILEKKYV